MQPTRIHRGRAVTALVCALLMGSVAQGAEATASDAMRAAAEAAKRDGDPSVNGAVGDVLRVPAAGTLLDAATAARQDSDPNLNGSPADSLPPKALVAGRSDLSSAWDAYGSSHWQAAYSAFAAAADAGVAEAARMALAMARHGSLLYRQSFVVSASQRGAWQRLGRFTATAAVGASSTRGATQ